jgi:hypothetical protein
LELLLTVEETSVREAASNSAKKLLLHLPDETFDRITPHVDSISGQGTVHGTYFGRGVDCIGVHATGGVMTQQDEHLQLFASLCRTTHPWFGEWRHNIWESWYETRCKFGEDPR